ncbi:hypothetical protein LTR22_024200 [Elasticomyces elasticus]|nr:hypothetical protein LTR22_024200 [Elasticomyces elasticus]KAK4909858.1 hypothetical protein LTR49_021398 [Elasticomyces elasticus]
MQDDVYSTSLDSTRHSKAAYLHWIGGLFFDQNKIQEAEELYSRALRAKEEAWGPKDTSTISIVNNLAILYEEQGKTQAAEEMYLRAIRGHERALGRSTGGSFIPWEVLAPSTSIKIRCRKRRRRIHGWYEGSRTCGPKIPCQPLTPFKIFKYSTRIKARRRKQKGCTVERLRVTKRRKETMHAVSNTYEYSFCPGCK